MKYLVDVIKEKDLKKEVTIHKKYSHGNRDSNSIEIIPGVDRANFFILDNIQEDLLNVPCEKVVFTK